MYSLYLDSNQLERLKLHKYASQGSSLFEPVMQVYWKWLVTKVPLWLAPNLITFIGFVINVVTTLPIIILDSNCNGIAPSWSYLACALGFFIYQSLDAIDGKQARRTDTSTPLGELFDHGCDAISTFLVVVSAVSAIGAQEYPLTVLGFILLLLVLNFCYHWQTYVCGVLHFKKIDVTEAQFLHIFILVLAGVMGTDVWLLKVPYLDMTLKMVLMYIVYGNTILNGLIAFNVILTSGVGKNGSTVADTSVLSPLIILFFQVPVVCVYTQYSMYPLQNHFVIFITAMTFPIVKSIILIVVGSMTKSPLGLMNIIMLGPLLAFGNVYFGSPLPEILLLTLIGIYNVLDVLWMCGSLCHQICDYLEISCFSIPYPPLKQDSTTTATTVQKHQ